VDLQNTRLVGRWVAVAALALLPALFAVERAKLMRPTDGAAYEQGPIQMIARAPDGRVEIDGKAIETESPFPEVLHASVDLPPGEHTLALIWEDGRKEAKFFVGEGAPSSFEAFRPHPGLELNDCAACHSVSRRGTFRFSGDCFACHTDEQYTASHPHPKHQLEQCGLCHNAHGSTADAHLLYPKETACTICHSL
jgi:predicted CXXCH cytochrome family protein